jgi:hypothetical protein
MNSKTIHPSKKCFFVWGKEGSSYFMKHYSVPKANLFLMELIIVILFLAISSTVCVQIFVKAHTVSKQAETKSVIQSQVQSVVSVFQTIDESEDVGEVFLQYFPNSQMNDEEIDIYYNENWEECMISDAVYFMHLQFVNIHKNHALAEMKIQIDTESEEIYTLSVNKYNAYRL